MTDQRSPGQGDWPLVLAASSGMLVTSLFVYTLGMFIQPLEAAFGWSRSGIAFSSTVIALVGLAAYPLVGLAVDRWGARALAVPGLAAYCLVLALLGLVGGSLWVWWTAVAVMTVAQIASGPAVWATGVTQTFISKRGMALGLTLAGGGVSAAVSPLLAGALIGAGDWRSAYLWLGVGGAVLTLPLVMMFFRPGASTRIEAGERRRWWPSGLGRALQTGTFTKIALASLAVTTAQLGLVIHFVPLVVGAGVERDSAAVFAGVIGVSSIVGRIVSGWLLDRVHVRFVGAGVYLLPLAAAIGLGQVETSLIIAPLLSAICLGLALGGELDIMAYCAGRYFNRRFYGSVFALLMTLMTIGAAAGSLVAARIYDLQQDYGPFLVTAGGLAVLSVMLIQALGRYPILDADISET